MDDDTSMTPGPACEAVRDRLPDWSAGRLPDEEFRRVEDHVARCAECQTEAQVVNALWRDRPTPRPDLADRIVTALEQDVAAPAGRVLRPVRPRWMLPAAAVLAAVFGGSLMWQSGIWSSATGPSPLEDEELLAEQPVATLFPSDDGLMAGAPVLDDLSDAALARLIEEMEG